MIGKTTGGLSTGTLGRQKVSRQKGKGLWKAGGHRKEGAFEVKGEEGGQWGSSE